jgi:hypothetical protein
MELQCCAHVTIPVPAAGVALEMISSMLASRQGYQPAQWGIASLLETKAVWIQAGKV